MKSLYAALLAALVFSRCSLSRAPEGTGEDRLLSQRIEVYVAERRRFYPVEATEAGVHDYDSALPRFTAADFKRRLDWLKDFHQRLLGIDLTTLSRESYFDALLLIGAVRAEIHRIERLETFKLTPSIYLSAIEDGLWSLAGREFRTSHERLRALVYRLREVPALAQAACSNLDRPGATAIEEGLVDVDRVQKLIGELPRYFGEVTNQQVMAELAAASEEADLALTALAVYLKEVQPGAAGPRPLGEERLREFLLYEEREGALPSEIRDLADRHLKESRARVRAAAERINPKKTALELLVAAGADHAPAGEFLAATRALVDDARTLAVDCEFGTLAAEIPIELAEAPSFLRDRARLALDRRRALPSEASRVRLFITAPELGWTDVQLERYLREMNRLTLSLDLARETYPGRYTALLALRTASTPLRRFLIAGSTLDGWGLYAEEIVARALADEDPLLDLAAGERAVLEDLRLRIALDFHRERLTLAQAAEALEREAGLTRAAAQKEALAITASPDSLKAPLAKLRILELQRDFTASGASLREFNDAFLRTGAVPVSLARVILFYETRAGRPPTVESASARPTMSRK